MRRSILFTRQQLGEMTGLSDDVLSYWIKGGLLVAAEGGSGRGSHRKFDYIQVHLAAVLREMHRYGANIGTLRSIAQIIHRGQAVCAGTDLRVDELSDAIRSASGILKFRAGESVEVYVPPENWRATGSRADGEHRPALSEMEIISYYAEVDLAQAPRYEHFLSRIENDSDIDAARRYHDLLDYSYLLPRTETTPHIWDDTAWLVVPNEGGWKFFDTAEGFNFPFAASSTLSGIYLGVARIFKSIWDGPGKHFTLRPPEIRRPMFTDEQQRERMRTLHKWHLACAAARRAGESEPAYPDGNEPSYEAGPL